MAKSQWTKAEPKGLPLIEIVCLVLEEAAQKVIRNKGAAGVDGVTFEDLPQLLENYEKFLFMQSKPFYLFV